MAMPPPTPDDIAARILAAFPTCDEQRPSPSEVERVMRPIGCISSDMTSAVQLLLRRAGRQEIAQEVGEWAEANIVVAGEPDDRERRIDFLLRDTCTCVLAYLPDAIANAAGGPVDPRIVALLQHPFFAQKDVAES